MRRGMSLLAEIWQRAGKIDCKGWGLPETSACGFFRSVVSLRLFCHHGGKNFVPPGQGGGFFQHPRDGTVFFFGERPGVFHGGLLRTAAPAAPVLVSASP